MSVITPPIAAQPHLSSVVPPITREELAKRSAEAIKLLDAWEVDASSDLDQRETMDLLRRVLGDERIDSSRAAILP